MRSLKIHNEDEKIVTGCEAYKDHYLSYYESIVAKFDDKKDSLESLSLLYTIRDGVDKDFEEFKVTELGIYRKILSLLSTWYKQPNNMPQNFNPEYHPSNQTILLNEVDANFRDISDVAIFLKQIYNIPPYMNHSADKALQKVQKQVGGYLDSEEIIKERKDIAVQLAENDNIYPKDSFDEYMGAVLEARRKVTISGAQRDAIRDVLKTVREEGKAPEHKNDYEFDYELIPEVSETIEQLKGKKGTVETIEKYWSDFEEEPDRFFDDDNHKQVNKYAATNHIKDECGEKASLPSDKTLGKRIGWVAKKKFWEKTLDVNLNYYL